MPCPALLGTPLPPCSHPSAAARQGAPTRPVAKPSRSIGCSWPYLGAETAPSPTLVARRSSSSASPACTSGGLGARQTFVCCARGSLLLLQRLTLVALILLPLRHRWSWT